MIRTPIALVPYLLAAAAVAGGLLWHAADRIGGVGRIVASGTATIGGPFRLTDQDGQTRTDKDFRGRFMLVYFGYSFCPDVCPTTLAMMANALDKLGPARGHVAPIFVTVDPARDTPQVLKTYVKSFGPDFVGLTGSPAEIDAAEKAYRVFARKHPLPGNTYAMDHSSEIVLMGPDGRFLAYYEEDVGPDALAADLRKRF
jgi:cytochrome oxidase Cu insertion factor (SCO1/SenC/PrrC family)